MDLLKEFYQELKGNPDITYLSDVWLPEVRSLFLPSTQFYLRPYFLSSDINMHIL